MAEGDAKRQKTMEPIKFTYFNLWAKGPAAALALEFSGLNWTGGEDYGDLLAGTMDGEKWAKDKKESPWGHVPLLDVPSIKGKVGQEIAILNVIGHLAPKVAGATPTEFATSQQLLCAAEEMFEKVSANSAKEGNEYKASEEERAAFWSASSNSTAHSKTYSLHAYLDNLERFYTGCGFGEGRFTSTGKTVGECKLFSILHAMVMIKKDGIFGSHPGVKAFYSTFLNYPETQDLIQTGGKMPRKFDQYWAK